MSLKKKLKKAEAEKAKNVQVVIEEGAYEASAIEPVQAVEKTVLCDTDPDSSNNWIQHPNLTDLTAGTTREKYDAKKHGPYPNVVYNHEKIEPVDVVEYNGMLMYFTDGPYKHVFTSTLNKLFLTAVGYGNHKEIEQINNLFKGKTYFHFKVGEVDLYLTVGSSVKVQPGTTKYAGILIADKLVAESLAVTGFNLCASRPEIKPTFIGLSDSLCVLGSDKVEINKRGLITNYRRNDYVVRGNVGGSLSLLKSVYFGGIPTNASFELEVSFVTNCPLCECKYGRFYSSIVHGGRLSGDYIQIRKARLSSTHITAKSVYINNIELTDKSIFVKEHNVSISNILELADLTHPLLPKICTVPLTQDRLLAHEQFSVTGGLVFELTDSMHEIQEQLLGWTSTNNKKILTREEAFELSNLLYSRLTVLRTIRNFETSKELHAFHKFMLPFLNNQPDDDWSNVEF